MLYYTKINSLMLIIIFIALLFIMGIVIGIMGKSKVLCVVSFILLIIYIILVVLAFLALGELFK